MKRAIAIVALAVALPALSGSAGASLDLSLQDPPGVPHIGTVMCLPASAGGQLSCPAPDPVESVTSAVASTPAPAATPAVAPSAADAAYGARLHAELCAARPVFCEVDQSGKYLTQ
ncbi:MAG: hypothetical protein M3357_12345 [Actinomycetota bacterium]|nr:hypothetical protein [Actinomycetota bacterium]